MSSGGADDVVWQADEHAGRQTSTSALPDEHAWWCRRCRLVVKTMSSGGADVLVGRHDVIVRDPHDRVGSTGAIVLRADDHTGRPDDVVGPARRSRRPCQTTTPARETMTSAWKSMRPARNTNASAHLDDIAGAGDARAGWPHAGARRRGAITAARPRPAAASRRNGPAHRSGQGCARPHPCCLSTRGCSNVHASRLTCYREEDAHDRRFERCP
jgi:hypothetical protein